MAEYTAPQEPRGVYGRLGELVEHVVLADRQESAWSRDQVPVFHGYDPHSSGERDARLLPEPLTDRWD